MARRLPSVWAVFALVLTLNLLLASHSRQPSAAGFGLRPLDPSSPSSSANGPVRRRSPIRSLASSLPPTRALARRSTFPFPDPPPPESPPASPWVLLPSLLAYTLALLGALGIVSGDYLVPNLSSLAASLGLSDNTAGVTLLAFGNGSPDVFATYASFTADSGSLAVGELLGVALFIVTVVVGSMALIQPFAVHRGPFLRDVGFALAAVALLLIALRDGELQTWEAVSMVGLYATYVAGVVGGGYAVRWRERRQQGTIKLLGDEEDGLLFDQEEEFDEEDSQLLSASDDLPASDGPRRSSLTVLPSPPAQRPISLGPVQQTAPADLLAPPSAADHRPALRISTSQASIASSTSSVRHACRPGAPPCARARRASSAASSQASFDVRRSTFSLLGAVEFRDLVNSLKGGEDEAASRQALQDGLVAGGSPFGGGHYHAHAQPCHTVHGHGARTRSASAVAGAAGGGGSVSAGQAARSPSVARQPAPDRRKSAGASVSLPAPGSSAMPAPTISASAAEHESEVNPWDDASALLSSSAQSGRTIRPGHYSPNGPGHLSRQPSSASLLAARGGAGDQYSPDRAPEPPSAPAIVLHSSTSSPSLLLPAGAEADPEASSAPVRPSNRRRAVHIARLTYHTLFPSLQQFGRKSYVGRTLSILAVPIILALTLTVCVVDDRNECGNPAFVEAPYKDDVNGAVDKEEPSHACLAAEVMHGRLLDLGESPSGQPSTPAHSHHPHHPRHPSYAREDGGSMNDHSAVGPRSGDREAWGVEDEREEGEEEDVEETEEEMCCEEECADVALGFNKWLLAAQCICGPTLSVLIVLPPDDAAFSWIPFAVVLATGVALAVLVTLCVSSGQHRLLRLARCLAGFAVSIFWIMALADEVVSVLTVMAELLGLSDAIVGLTVFAIGNSTADLVADLSIATFSPIMAFSACFGGPMLNILLGIGLSGAYVTLSSGRPYPIQISASLVTSVVGLLLVLAVTFVYIPYNKYRIERRWGAFLIGFYVVAMTINVLAEIFWT